MKFMIQNLPLIVTVLTALAGAIGWGIGRVSRNYGLERDIAHLKRDYKTLSDHSAQLLTELERRLDAVEKDAIAIKAVNQSLIARQPGN